MSFFTILKKYHFVKPSLFYSKEYHLFNSTIKIKLPLDTSESVYDKAFHIINTIDKKYNSYSDESFIYNINKNCGFFVKVDKVTIYLLEKIKYYSDLLNNEYDITIMPLLRLWGFYEARNTIPSNIEIENSKKYVDYKKIEILKNGKNQVKIAKNQEIITGSFIKSFGADKIKEYLKDERITDALINISSSTIIAINKKKKYWELIIEDPDDDTKDLFLLKLSNMALSISGNSNSFITINNENYGHIISPKTGMPTKNKLVVIISSTGFKSDVFSTGLYNLSGENFIANINKLDGIEGFLMNEKREIFYSKNFKNKIIKKYI